MIKIENVEVYGFDSAIRGMRNPLNSHDKSDSHVKAEFPDDRLYVGENDFELMMKLVKAGSDHSKFMRMINVILDITAPMYYWKEFDTYKVGTVRNSCSTMHTIHKKEFTLDDFSCEHLIHEIGDGTELYCADGDSIYSPSGVLKHLVIPALNKYRNLYIRTKNKEYWWQIIQLLPSSYNQRATVQLNYAVLRNMYHSRKNHKLDEWREFCKWIESLPYSKLITM